MGANMSTPCNESEVTSKAKAGALGDEQQIPLGVEQPHLAAREVVMPFIS
ncbi:MAG TPA: hypothetical protein VMV97_07715 [Sulfuriferula sp.]|nr:hypothetical protein [Sulfuriferula sp.]